MYESFYKLNAKPFRLSPDPTFFYPSSGHKRALAYLLYGLNQGEGFVVITGAPGTGKTTLAHKLLSQIDPAGILVAHLSSTQVEADDLLRLVATSFKLRSENVSKAALIKDIESFLIARSRERKRCLLVVDEAQNLPSRSIEELRMLSNFQVNHHALLQVFLLGQEQFRTMIDSPDLEQLQQRVIANFHLHPLDLVETQRYIESRLRQCGWANDPYIDEAAYKVIYSYTGGLPRRINMFCDRLFLFGYMEGLHVISAETVTNVIEELKMDVSSRSRNVVFTPVERQHPSEPEIAPSASTDPREATAPVPEPATDPMRQPAIESIEHAEQAEQEEESTQAAPRVASMNGSSGPSPSGSKDRPMTDSFAASLFAKISEIEGSPEPIASPATSRSERPSPPPDEIPTLPLSNERTEFRPDRAAAPSAPKSDAAIFADINPRWTGAVGIVVVLLIIGYWFFPYFQDSSTTSEKQLKTAESPTSKLEPRKDRETRPVIVDPTENVIRDTDLSGAASSETETADNSGKTPGVSTDSKRLAPTTASAMESAVADAPQNVKETKSVRAESPRVEDAATNISNQKRVQNQPREIKSTVAESPDLNKSTRKTAEKTPAVVEAKTTEARPSAKPTSSSSAPEETTQVPTLFPTPTPQFVTTPAPVVQEEIQTGKLPAEIPTNVATAEPPAGIEPISQLELAQMLLKFSRYYE